MNDKTILALAKMAHTNNSIWSKLKEESIKDFTCDWNALTEYQRELYIAGIELMVIQYRVSLSPLRRVWRLYYRFFY